MSGRRLVVVLGAIVVLAMAAIAAIYARGVLYARQGNLGGVSVSHILCGWFVFLVLGFEPWY